MKRPPAATGMACPECGAQTWVVDSRRAPDNEIRRRRECGECEKRFTTMERPVGAADVDGLAEIKKHLGGVVEQVNLALAAVREVVRRGQ